MRSNRRLYVTADRTEIVGEGDSRAAFLLVGKGCEIALEDLEQFGLDEEALADALAALPPEPATSGEISVPPHPGEVPTGGKRPGKGRGVRSDG